MADQNAPRFADTAAKILNDAGEWTLGKVPDRQLAALQGIGCALLAVEERLSALADAADDRNFQLAQIEEATGVLRPAGAGRNGAVRRWLRGFLRRHPDAVISVAGGKSTDAGAWMGGGAR